MTFDYEGHHYKTELHFTKDASYKIGDSVAEEEGEGSCYLVFVNNTLRGRGAPSSVSVPVCGIVVVKESTVFAVILSYSMLLAPRQEELEQRRSMFVRAAKEYGVGDE